MRQNTPWSGSYSPPPPSLSALSSSDFMMNMMMRVSVIQTRMMIGFSSLPQWLKMGRPPLWVKSLWSIYYQGRHTLSTLLLKMLTITTPSVNSSSSLQREVMWRIAVGMNQKSSEKDQQLFHQYYKEVQKSLLEKWIIQSVRSPLQVPLEFFHTTAFASVCFSIF